MGMSTTIKTKIGDVTLAAHGKCEQLNEGPVVVVAITLGLMTYPIPMTAAQARGLGTIINTAASSAELAHHNAAVARGAE